MNPVGWADYGRAMARRAHIPSQPDEMSPGWLTSVMRSAGSLGPDAWVEGLVIEALAGGGTGLSGDTVRVRLRYGGAVPFDAPASMIAKFPTSDVANRGMVESLDVYAREIEFYRDLAAQVPARVPRHFGSDYTPGRSAKPQQAANRLIEKLPARAHLAATKDITKFMRASSRRYALLIEDFGSGEVHDLVNPPPVERMRQLIETLADVHAAFWGRTDLLDHPSTKWLITDIPTTFVNVYNGRCIPMAEERWGAWITDNIRDLFAEAAERFADDVVALNEPLTLVHGDPRSDNVLYWDDGEMVLLDWAQPGFAHPAYDVAYSLSAGVRVDDHATHGLALRDSYFERLSSQIPDPIDRDAFDLTVDAVARAILLQNINSLAVLQGDYGEDGLLADLWVPRLLALLGAPPVGPS